VEKIQMMYSGLLEKFMDLKTLLMLIKQNMRLVMAIHLNFKRSLIRSMILKNLYLLKTGIN
jgi:hypothetical protein